MNNDGNIILNKFHVRPKISRDGILNKGQIKKAIRRQRHQIGRMIDRFTNKGSGWTVHRIARQILGI